MKIEMNVRAIVLTLFESFVFFADILVLLILILGPGAVVPRDCAGSVGVCICLFLNSSIILTSAKIFAIFPWKLECTITEGGIVILPAFIHLID